MYARENETLYLTSWEYNACKVINALEKIVVNNGGHVRPTTKFFIVNRALNESIHELEMKIERLENAIRISGENKPRKAALAKYTEELANYRAIPNGPLPVSRANYITFILDCMLYYYQIDENPFFEFYYQKVEIAENGTYSKDIYSTEDPKKWADDCLLRFSCQEAEITKAANAIFDMLCNAKESEHYNNTKKIRVENLYDNGFHYETVREKERIGKIDF